MEIPPSIVPVVEAVVRETVKLYAASSNTSVHETLFQLSLKCMAKVGSPPGIQGSTSEMYLLVRRLVRQEVVEQVIVDYYKSAT